MGCFGWMEFSDRLPSKMNSSPLHTCTFRISSILSVALVTLWLVAGCRSHSDVEKGTLCLQLGDYAMAESFFTAALHRNPSNFDARLGLGKAFLQRASDFDDTVSWRNALVQLEAARTLRPSGQLVALLSRAWFKRAQSLLGSGDTVGGLGGLTRAIEYDPVNAEYLNLAGIVYFRMGEPQKARILFTRAVNADSADIPGYFNLGMVEWNERNITGAHENWMKALTRAPEDRDILYWFARAEKELRSDGGK
jgi:tetratricopeptide (TPR) repeat protein